MQLKPLFKDIANAIRWKDGTTGPIAAENFPSRIRNIAGSGTGNNIFQALEILRPPIRTVYKVGQKLDMDGVKAKVYAYGGYVYDADVDSLSFTPANGAEITAALQSVKVTYSSLDGAYEISNYLPVSVDASPAACFGVMWNYGEESSELTRLTPESDPNGFVTACPDTEPVPYAGGTDRQPSSPFDNYFPWRKMQEYNIVGDTVTAKQGDAGFSRANFDTMVYIPEFYYNVVKDETEKTICYYVSDTMTDGFERHPGSDVYVGRYHTSRQDAGSMSVSQSVALAISQKSFREAAKEKGQKWYLCDYFAFCAIWLLYLVEYRTWDSSILGYGIVRVLNSLASKQESGLTDDMPYHTGCVTAGAPSAVQYRHIENPWGNVRYGLDGAFVSLHDLYIGEDRDKYADTIGQTEAALITNALTSINGYPVELQVEPAAKYAFIPSAAKSGEQSLNNPVYIPDKYTAYAASSSSRVVCISSHSTSSTSSSNCWKAGLFALESCSSGSQTSSFGGRMMFTNIARPFER